MTLSVANLTSLFYRAGSTAGSSTGNTVFDATITGNSETLHYLNVAYAQLFTAVPIKQFSKVLTPTAYKVEYAYSDISGILTGDQQIARIIEVTWKQGAFKLNLNPMNYQDLVASFPAAATDGISTVGVPYPRSFAYREVGGDTSARKVFAIEPPAVVGSATLTLTAQIIPAAFTSTASTVDTSLPYEYQDLIAYIAAREALSVINSAEADRLHRDVIIPKVEMLRKRLLQGAPLQAAFISGYYQTRL